MAGIKGMRHKRPRTAQERDAHALQAIENFIDDGVTKCDTCFKTKHLHDVSPTHAQLMMRRYDKLRPTLSASEVKMTIESMGDVLKRIAEHEGRLIEHEPAELSTDCTAIAAPQHEDNKHE